MNKRKVLSLLVFAVTLLTACASPAGHGAASATPPAAATPPVSVAERQDPPQDAPYLLTAQQGIVMTVGGETANGCYSLDPYPDGTADIIYYDYATAQCVRLSSAPNTGHDPASTAYIPSFKGGARCLVSGDVLYVIKSGQPYTDPAAEGNDPTATLYCMDLDGSDRTVLRYGTNLVFQWDGCVAGDKHGNLYTVLLIVDKESTKTTSVLAKFGRDIEGYEVLYTWEEPVHAKLVGVCGTGFVVQLQDTGAPGLTTKLVLVQDKTESQPFLEWSGLDVSSYTIHNNVLYYTKNGDADLYTKTILQDTAPVCHAPFAYEDFQPTMALLPCEVRDDHLIVQYLGVQEGVHTEKVQSHYAALDLDTNVFTPLNLYCGEGDDKTFVGIYAEGEHDFLVRVGKFTRTRTDYGTDGVPYRFEQGFEDYVLISKSDYWSNQANYRRFQYYE